IIELPEGQPAETPTRSPEEIAAELDSLLPEVTSGDEGEGGGRSRSRSRNRGQRGDGDRDGQQRDGNGKQQDGEGRSRNRRDRKRGRGGAADDVEPEISDDDVLIPVAGILDVLDNYAFVRTSGYLPGPN